MLAVTLVAAPLFWITTGTTAAPSAVEQPSAGLDDFKCYKVNEKGEKFRQRVVSLLDQFTTEAETEGGYFGPPVTVVKPVLLCPPASKNGTPIGDEITHLKCYQIKPPKTPPFQPRRVRVDNQFGTAILKPEKPTTLCVPSTKRVGTQPPGSLPASSRVDHFKCYQVKSETSFQQRTVRLDDQFGAAIAKVSGPKSLCNPAEKDGQPMQRPQAHLVCYGIDGKGPNLLVSVRNQFGLESLRVEGPQTLCVPSRKTLL